MVVGNLIYLGVTPRDLTREVNINFNKTIVYIFFIGMVLFRIALRILCRHYCLRNFRIIETVSRGNSVHRLPRTSVILIKIILQLGKLKMKLVSITLQRYPTYIPVFISFLRRGWKMQFLERCLRPSYLSPFQRLGQLKDFQ